MTDPLADAMLAPLRAELLALEARAERLRDLEQRILALDTIVPTGKGTGDGCSGRPGLTTPGPATPAAALELTPEERSTAVAEFERPHDGTTVRARQAPLTLEVALPAVQAALHGTPRTITEIAQVLGRHPSPHVNGVVRQALEHHGAVKTPFGWALPEASNEVEEPEPPAVVELDNSYLKARILSELAKEPAIPALLANRIDADATDVVNALHELRQAGAAERSSDERWHEVPIA